MAKSLVFALYGIVCALIVVQSQLIFGDIVVPGTASAAQKVDGGHFTGGTVLDLSVTGTVDLIPQTGFHWITNPDGSLVFFNHPTAYRYALPGSTQYPTTFGGDGVNHYPGGGANFDTSPFAANGQFGFAGEETTDTTNSGTIRFGAIVYTFSPNPNRNDWHFLGYGDLISVPFSGANIYFAINDGNNNFFPGANSGQYFVNISAIPEPNSLTMLIGAMVTVVFRNRRSR